MQNRRIALLVGLGLCELVASASAVPASADMAAGYAALKREDWESARAAFAPAAEQGDPIAQYNYGLLLQQGRGGPEDAAAAAVWFEKSARLRHKSAAYAMGLLYAQQDPPDWAEAYAWFRIASKLGHVEARRNLYPVARSLTPDQTRDARKRADEFLQDR